MKLGKRQLRTLINEMMGDLDLSARRAQVTPDIGLPSFDDEVETNEKPMSDVDIISALLRSNNNDNRIASMVADELSGDKSVQEEMLKSGMLQVAISAALTRLSRMIVSSEAEELFSSDQELTLPDATDL